MIVHRNKTISANKNKQLQLERVQYRQNLFTDKQKAFVNMNNIFTILNKLFLGIGFLAPNSGYGDDQLLTAPNKNHPGVIWVMPLKGL